MRKPAGVARVDAAGLLEHTQRPRPLAVLIQCVGEVVQYESVRCAPPVLVVAGNVEGADRRKSLHTDSACEECSDWVARRKTSVIALAAIFVWLFSFALFYTLYNKMSPDQAFYYAVQSGLSIGFGALSEEWRGGQAKRNATGVWTNAPVKGFTNGTQWHWSGLPPQHPYFSWMGDWTHAAATGNNPFRLSHLERAVGNATDCIINPLDGMSAAEYDVSKVNEWMNDCITNNNTS